MKRFNKYVHGQFKSLVACLEAIPSSQNIEDIHKLRITMKKVKAVTRVVKSKIKNLITHENPTFKKIFRNAGKIREPQVLAKLLLQYEIEGVKVTKLTEDDRGIARRFATRVPVFVENIKDYAPKVEHYAAKIHKANVKEFIKKQRKKIRSYLKPGTLTRDLHKTRKVIKSVIYLSEIAGTLKTKEMRFYRRLDEIIGQWHDKQKLMSFLKRDSNLLDHTSYNSLKAAGLNDEKEIVHLSRKFYS